MSPTVTPPVEKQHRRLHLPLASGGPLSMRILQARILEWVAMGEAAPQPEGSSVSAQQAPARLGFGSTYLLGRCSAHSTSLPSPHLLVAGAGVCAASPLGELPLGS